MILQIDSRSFKNFLVTNAAEKKFVYTLVSIILNSYDNSLDHNRKYVVESQSSRHIALCIYNAHRDGRFTWHVLAIFISRAITRGVAGNTYYHENICKSLPRDIDVGYSPFASLFRTTFFHLQSPCHPAPFPPLAFTVPHRPRGIASDIRHIRGSLCFMANCFIIFDIFPVYGRGSAFCFMAVYCTWWTSLYVPPWIIPRPTPASCFIRETFAVSDMISGIFSWQKGNLHFRIASWTKMTYYLIRNIKILLIACLFLQYSLLLRGPYDRLIQFD